MDAIPLILVGTILPGPCALGAVIIGGLHGLLEVPARHTAADDAGKTECDVPPDFRTVLGWNFPLKIPMTGEGEFHEEIEVLGGADRLHFAPGG